MLLPVVDWWQMLLPTADWWLMLLPVIDWWHMLLPVIECWHILLQTDGICCLFLLQTDDICCCLLLNVDICCCRLMAYAVSCYRLMTYAVACYWLMTYAVAYYRLMTYAVACYWLMSYAVAYCRLITYVVAFCWVTMHAVKLISCLCTRSLLCLLLHVVTCCYHLMRAVVTCGGLLSTDVVCSDLMWPAVAYCCLLSAVANYWKLFVNYLALWCFSLYCTERCTPVVCRRACIWLAWFVVALSGGVKTFTWGIADREFWNDWTLSLWLHTPSLSMSAFSAHTRENWCASHDWRVGFLLWEVISICVVTRWMMFRVVGWAGWSPVTLLVAGFYWFGTLASLDLLGSSNVVRMSSDIS